MTNSFGVLFTIAVVSNDVDDQLKSGARNIGSCPREKSSAYWIRADDERYRVRLRCNLGRTFPPLTFFWSNMGLYSMPLFIDYSFLKKFHFNLIAGGSASRATNVRVSITFASLYLIFVSCFPFLQLSYYRQLCEK